MKIFRLLFLVAVAFAADESTDEEKSACENETSIIQATPEYQASYELVVQGIEEIDNTCVKDGGWFICEGALPESTMQNMTETCTTLGGQIIELKNVRLTCKPSGNSTHTVLEVIPECVGGVCTEDEVGDLKDDYLDDLLDTALEDFDGASYCVIDDSSEAVKSLSVIGRTVLVIALSVFFSVV